MHTSSTLTPGGPTSRRAAQPHQRSWTQRVALLSAAALLSAFGVVSASPAPALAADPIATVPLGLVATFGILTPAAVGNAAPEPATVIRGDVGGGGAITGFPPGIITGAVYTGTAVNPMMTDLQTAYNNAADRPAGTPLPADFAGQNFLPGVHTTIAAAGTAAGGSFTIDGEGNPDSVFIFQIGGALALGANTTMTLVDGAQAKNVFWQVVGAGGLGAGTEFVGTLMAGTAVSGGAGSTVNGRLLSLTGAITMSSVQLYSSPPSVFINGGAAAFTTSSEPLISGVTNARTPMTVIVSIDGIDQTPELTPSDTGDWSYMAPPLINGPHTIVARSVDGAGNVGSFTQTLTVDTTLPIVTIDGGDVVTTNDLTPTISGTTDIAPDGLVTLTSTRTSPPTTLTRTAIVQDDQTWSISPTGFTAGEWTIVARVADPAGNESTDSQTLIIDATAPAAAITSSALTNDPTPTITGTTEAGATVAVSIDGLALTGVSQGAIWSATTTVALGHGNHNVSVASTDTAGNSTVLTQTLNVDLVLPVVAISPGPINSANDSTPTIIGTTDVAIGTTVSVTIDGGAPLAAFVQNDGWNVTPSTPLSLGDHTIVASVTDPAGNVGTATQTLTIDTTNPTVVITGGNSRTSADATPTITGSSPDVLVGSDVTVQVAGQTLTTTITAGGLFSVTAAAISPNSTYFVFVTVTDAAGNTGNANQSLTINAIAPTVTFSNGPATTTNDTTPLIGGTTTAAVGSSVVVTVDSQTLHATVQPGGSWNVTAASLAAGPFTVLAAITDLDGNVGTATQVLTVDSSAPTTIVITGGASRSTNDNTPTISGTTDAAEGAIVTVTVAGQTLTAPAAAGTWSVTAAAITDGTYVATAAVGSGPGLGSTTQLLTIDTIDPVVVVGGGEPVVQTTDPTPAISGSGATPGSTVTVTVAGQTLTTTVGPDGTWSVTPNPPLPAGDNLVTVTITDPAGNTGSGTQTITVIVVPTTVTITGGATATTNDDTPTISGTTSAADGRILVVTVSTQTLTTLVANGAWTVQATQLADGVYNVTASVGVVDGTPAASAQSLTVAMVVMPPSADFTSVGPKRVFDTRPGASSNALRAVAKQKVGGGYELVVKMTDLAGFVPTDGVGAVSLNVTATGSTAAGFITVYACGIREEVSSVNFTAGRNVANAVLTPVSASGTVCFYADTPTHIIVDINGWFAAGEAFHSVGPKRVFDTRAGASPNALRTVPKTKLAAGSTLEVRLTDLPGYVPADGVGAVSLNVLVTDPAADGFITVYACDTLKEVSSLNHVAGQTVANAVVAAVSPTGTVCFYSSAATNLIADINGWIEAESSFHALSPVRVLDTRPGSADGLRAVPKAKIGGGNVLQVQVSDLPGYTPAMGISAVSLNVTATGPEGPGFITVYACGTMEEVSSLNYDTGSTVANAVLAPVSAAGTICLYSIQLTDVIVDINAWIGTSPPG